MSPDCAGERYTPSVSPSDFRILVKALMSQQMPTFLKEATLREQPHRGLGENRGQASPPEGSVLAREPAANPSSRDAEFAWSSVLPDLRNLDCACVCVCVCVLKSRLPGLLNLNLTEGSLGICLLIKSTG